MISLYRANFQCPYRSFILGRYSFTSRRRTAKSWPVVTRFYLQCRLLPVTVQLWVRAARSRRPFGARSPIARRTAAPTPAGASRGAMRRRKLSLIVSYRLISLFLTFIIRNSILGKYNLNLSLSHVRIIHESQLRYDCPFVTYFIRDDLSVRIISEEFVSRVVALRLWAARARRHRRFYTTLSLPFNVIDRFKYIVRRQLTSEVPR